jgi:hypothetical protein
MPSVIICTKERIMKTIKTVMTFTAVLALIVAADAARAFDEMPEQVTIDSLATYYGPAEFDHAMHTELGEDCSVCHHHTMGTGTNDERCMSCHADDNEVATVACGDCHMTDPFSAENINLEAADRYRYHIDRPGLKAAYHWNCLGCHEEMDGPTACQDCHARTAEGDAFFHADVQPADSGGGHH